MSQFNPINLFKAPTSPPPAGLRSLVRPIAGAAVLAGLVWAVIGVAEAPLASGNPLVVVGVALIGLGMIKQFALADH